MRAIEGGFMCSVDTLPEPVGRAFLGMTSCCAEAIAEGPAACTCWVPDYSVAQCTQPLEDEPLTVRSEACADCAYRPDSPERAGDERYMAASVDELERIARTAVFWCHDGMRKVKRYRHKSLPIVIAADGDFYKPPITMRAGIPVPHRADGRPGLMCAGWAARARHIDGNFAWLAEPAIEIPT